MNGRQIAGVVGGVILLLIIFLLGLRIFTNIFSPSPKKVEKVETVSKNSNTQWKKSVEKRFQKNNTEHKIINSRLDKHADAISDLQSQIDSLREKPKEGTEIVELKKEQPKKKNKYKKGWDFRDFPENW